MATANPADVAKKWSQNLGAATTAITNGVNAVTQNPAQQAAAAVDRYQAGVLRAVQSGAYVNGLSKVTTQSWKDSMINKGIPRIQSGASQAIPKMTAFMNVWLPFMQTTVANLPPRGDVNQNIARAVAMMTAAAGFKGQH